jgi:hypothetical protein
VILINEFQQRLSLFPVNYSQNFKHFWNWKCIVEKNGSNILDEANIDEAYKRLRYILPKWQTYRPSSNPFTFLTLKESLRNISQEYNIIREYTLLEFDIIPKKSLEKIWNELGRVKEKDGEYNSLNEYYIIAICKPLMLLWGQTLAFDKKVRSNIPKTIKFSRYKFRWRFNQWHTTLKTISQMVKQNNKLVQFIKENTKKRYKKDLIVPYGRYLDIYYWVGGDTQTPLKPPRKGVYDQIIDSFLDSDIKIANVTVKRYDPHYLRIRLIKCIERREIKNIEVFVANSKVYIEKL